MPRIADYLVITDDKFTLQTGGDIDRDFNFTLEGGAHLSSRCVLAFVLFVHSGAVSRTFEVRINGSPQLSYTFRDKSTHTLHEVVSGTVLSAGTNNIEFRITAGQGALEFGDAVLFYQRDI